MNLFKRGFKWIKRRHLKQVTKDVFHGYTQTVDLKLDPISYQTIAKTLDKLRPDITKIFEGRVEDLISQQFIRNRAKVIPTDAIPLRWDIYLKHASKIHHSQILYFLLSETPDNIKVKAQFDKIISPLGFPVIPALIDADKEPFLIQEIPIYTTTLLPEGLYVMVSGLEHSFHENNPEETNK